MSYAWRWDCRWECLFGVCVFFFSSSKYCNMWNEMCLWHLRVSSGKSYAACGHIYHSYISSVIIFLVIKKHPKISQSKYIFLIHSTVLCNIHIGIETSTQIYCDKRHAITRLHVPISSRRFLPPHLTFHLLNDFFAPLNVRNPGARVRHARARATFSGGSQANCIRGDVDSKY